MLNIVQPASQTFFDVFLTPLFLFFFSVPEVSVSAVQGSSVELPCNLTAPIFGDRVRLVLWFKNDSNRPIYTYDTRGEDKSHKEARHWSDDKVLTGRAFFKV